MKVVIAGAHGKIALLLIPQLVVRGDIVVGLVRNPDHVAEIQSLGASAAVCDLESAALDAVSATIDGCDAVVFAAGAGAGSSAERKLTMDRDGAVLLLAAAARTGIARYLIVSSVGAEAPPAGNEIFSVYLQAKAAADAAVQASDRAWTIVRPGRLTDDPGTGAARIDATPYRGEVAREDIASVIAALLPDPRAAGQILYVNGGETPVAEALDAVLGGH